MKQYDSIDYYGDHWGIPVIAVDKLDGSNLRFEYSHKRGFYKFGTRGNMIDASSDYGFAIDLFLTKYADGLTKIFKSKEYRNIQSFVCFAELVGTKSEFGQHVFGDDDFDIILFDINAYKKGLIPPRQFIKDFGHLGIPKIIYEGNLNIDFVQKIKNGFYDLKEGVICKSTVKTKKNKDINYYCKIKQNSWFDRLRSKNIELYEAEMKEVNLIEM